VQLICTYAQMASPKWVPNDFGWKVPVSRSSPRSGRPHATLARGVGESVPAYPGVAAVVERKGLASWGGGVSAIAT